MQTLVIRYSLQDFLQMTGKRISEITGIDEKQLSNWFWGREITEKNINAMAQAFNITPSQMLRWLNKRREIQQSSDRSIPWYKRDQDSNK